MGGRGVGEVKQEKIIKGRGSRKRVCKRVGRVMGEGREAPGVWLLILEGEHAATEKETII